MKRSPQRITLRRAVFIGTLCLILGAVMTVVVAWGLNLMHDWDDQRWDASLVDTSLKQCSSRWHVQSWSFGTFELVVSEYRESDRWTVADQTDRIAFIDALPKWATLLRNRATEDWRMQAEHHVLLLAQGWPSVALWAEQRPGNDGYFFFEIDRGSLSRTLPQWSFQNCYHPRQQLPIYPAFPGFLINTLFYAAIWFGLFFGIGAARRAIRRRRGRCPMCGYDLRGQNPDGPRPRPLSSPQASRRGDRGERGVRGCPECGWGRREEPTS